MKNFNFRPISGFHNFENFISCFRAYYQKTQNEIRILSFLAKKKPACRVTVKMNSETIGTRAFNRDFSFKDSEDPPWKSEVNRNQLCSVNQAKFQKKLLDFQTYSWGPRLTSFLISRPIYVLILKMRRINPEF